MNTEAQPDAVRTLSAYQAACRRFDVAAAVAFFTADGLIEYAGETHAGAAALRNAHLWDRAARNEIALLDLAGAGDTVQCTFANQHELHRVLGLPATRSAAEITLRGGQIAALRILRPEPESWQAFRERAGPFFDWVRANHQEAWQRTAVLDEVGGGTLYELAHAWQAARAHASS